MLGAAGNKKMLGTKRADTDFMMDKILTPAFHGDRFSISNYFSLLHHLALTASVDSPQEEKFDNANNKNKFQAATKNDQLLHETSAKKRCLFLR